MKASIKNYRQSPRKVRLVADFIRGKDVSKAIAELRFVAKRASLPMKKLIESAVANAKNNFSVSEDKLFIKEVTVDKGITLKRFRAGARGRAFPIRKRTSNIKVVLGLVKDSK